MSIHGKFDIPDSLCTAILQETSEGIFFVSEIQIAE